MELIFHNLVRSTKGRHMKKQLFIFILAVISMSSTAFAEKPGGKTICKGAHSETGAPVYGECFDGKFTGFPVCEK